MKNNFNILLNNYQFQANFPDQCLYCGKLKNTIIESNFSIEEKKDGKTEKHEISIPRFYCTEHANMAKRNAKIIQIIMLTSIIPAIALAIWMVISILKDGIFGISEGDMHVFLTILGGFAGAFCGFWITVLIINGIKSLIGLIIRTPLDHPLAITLNMQQEKQSVFIKFDNKEVAQNFYELNKELIEKKE